MKAKLVIATSRYDYDGPDRLDITVKSAKGMGRVLAPTWAMVDAYQREVITWPEYRESYYALMRQRYMGTVGGYPFDGCPFDQFMTLGRVVLVCHCVYHNLCHRTLAARILGAIAEDRGIEVEYAGELRTQRQRAYDLRNMKMRGFEDTE